MPKVSVIVPVYNVEKYLAKCLDSLLIQSFPDFEAICINDGSSDNSLQILEEYAKKDSRIIAINQINQGVSAARNIGLEKASGEYIAFFDSDDVMHPQFFELMLYALNTSKADFVWCPFEEFKRDEEIHYQTYSIENKYSVFKDTWNRFLVRKKPHSAVTLWNKLFKKEILAGLRFNENLSIGEDFLFTHQYLYKVQKSCLLNLPLMFYRQRAGSAMNSSLEFKTIDNHIAFGIETLKFAKTAGIKIQETKQIQKRIIKIILKTIVKTPYKKDRQNCEDYWNYYADKMQKHLQEGTLKKEHLSLKNRIYCNLLIARKFKLLKLLCKL